MGILYNIFPEWLYKIITNNYMPEFIYEIRIRLNKPIVINYKGNYNVLIDKNNYNASSYNNSCIVANQDLITYIITVATKQSYYAYNDQIKHCYITTDSGIRIGLCGTVVYNNNSIATIKNITSLNIRISHQVDNCSDRIINFIYVNGFIKNTLIISPPGAGKTTLVRDIVNKLSNEKKVNNILVVDERYEIAGIGINKNIDIGMYADVISGSSKSFAFNECLKTMCPSVIVTDEVSEEKDVESIKNAIKSGVKVIATAHAQDTNDLKFKKYFEIIVKDKYFERIVVLSTRCGVGTIEGIYDENLRGIFIPYML